MTLRYTNQTQIQMRLQSTSMSASPCFPFNPIVDYSNPSNLSLASSPDLPDSCNLYSPLDIASPLAQFSNDYRSSLGFSAGPTWPASDPTANSPSLASATHETLLASRNAAYFQLYQRVTILVNERDIIQAKFNILQ